MSQNQKVDITIYSVDLDAGRVEELSHGSMDIIAKDRKGALMRCQKMFGPCRGSAEGKEWRFLTSDGLIVKIKFLD